MAQNTISYDGWGSVVSESNGSFGDRWKWTGRELDSETGLQYNRWRYYNPAHGRLSTIDLLGFDAADANLYRYTGNNTVNRQDPTGLVSSDNREGSGLAYAMARFNFLKEVMGGKRVVFPSAELPSELLGYSGAICHTPDIGEGDRMKVRSTVRQRKGGGAQFVDPPDVDLGSVKSWKDLANKLKEEMRKRNMFWNGKEKRFSFLILNGHGTWGGVMSEDGTYKLRVDELDPETAKIISDCLTDDAIIVLVGCGCGNSDERNGDLGDKLGGHPVLGNKDKTSGTTGINGKPWVIVPPRYSSPLK